jgi:hypothetical protein
VGSVWPSQFTEHSVEALEGGKWRTITTGKVIGHKQLRRFPSVTAQRVRLIIDQASASPVSNLWA